MTDVVELQRQTIKKLEDRNKELVNDYIDMLDMNNRLTRVLEYLTDEEFRKFVFKLNYDRLITDYLENESNGEEVV